MDFIEWTCLRGEIVFMFLDHNHSGLDLSGGIPPQSGFASLTPIDWGRIFFPTKGGFDLTGALRKEGRDVRTIEHFLSWNGTYCNG